MARRSDDIHHESTAPHDGAVLCALCSAKDAASEWCDVSFGLMCDDCCDAIQEGDPELLIPLIVRTNGSISLKDAFETCLACSRMATHVVRGAPGAEAAPPC